MNQKQSYREKNPKDHNDGDVGFIKNCERLPVHCFFFVVSVNWPTEKVSCSVSRPFGLLRIERN